MKFLSIAKRQLQLKARRLGTTPAIDTFINQFKGDQMKTIYSILSLATLAFLIASALPAQAQEESEMDPAETYAMFCGSRAELTAWAKSKGQKITKSDFLELSEQRSPILNVLKNGKRAIKQILDEGDKSDTGPFGAILTCGMLVQIKDQVLQKGCYDLSTNKPVRDAGGIKACEDLMSRLPK